MLSEAGPARKADFQEPEGKSSLPDQSARFSRRAYKALSMVEMNACGTIDKAILQVQCNSAPVIQSARSFFKFVPFLPTFAIPCKKKFLRNHSFGKKIFIFFANIFYKS